MLTELIRSLHAMTSCPSLYLFDRDETHCQLYFGEFTSLQGMMLLGEDLTIEQISLGTTDSRNLSWATEEDFPAFRTSGELKDFMRPDEIAFSLFEVSFKDFGSLKTHDDGECHFRLLHRKDAIELIKRASPDEYQTLVLLSVLDNPNKYVSLDSNGRIKLYQTFDQYLEEGHSR